MLMRKLESNLYHSELLFQILHLNLQMESGSEFAELIASSIRSLNHISRICDLSATPSIENGNHNNHAIGLGAMNLHGFLALQFTRGGWVYECVLLLRCFWSI
jgi:ribonucleotide reductase alpha subunit